jgi:Replication-relaxation
MTGPSPWSGRRSGRVVSQPVAPTEIPGSERISVPESLSSLGASVLAPRRAPERRGRRVSQRRLEFIQRDLNGREQAILSSLQQFRFLTARQLQALHFHDHSSEQAARICRRVLARLHELHVIDHLQRRVGGIRAGSASYVWRVGLVGDRLLRQASGDGARLRPKEPSARYLDHCLAVADCYLALVGASRAGRCELVRVDTEPTCWRRYLSAGGTRETLKPDLYAVTAVGDYEEDLWFIEVDRGTESLPTLIKKCAQYERYRRTGRQQAASGVFPLVIWLLPDATRQSKLQAALHAARGLDIALFRITTAERFIDVIRGGAT